MENERLDNLYMETAKPRAGRITSRGGLLAVLLAGAVLIQTLRHAFGHLLPFSPQWIQIPLYAALFAWAAWYASRRLAAYRYTLTDETFCVELLTERHARRLVCVPLADLLPSAERGCRTIHAFTGGRRDAGALYLRRNGRAVRLLHSMSPAMCARLDAAKTPPNQMGTI